jgi:hypothetical protein
MSSKLEQAELYFTVIISFVATTNFVYKLLINNHQSTTKEVLSTTRAPAMQQDNFSSSRTSLEWGLRVEEKGGGTTLWCR